MSDSAPRASEAAWRAYSQGDMRACALSPAIYARSMKPLRSLARSPSASLSSPPLPPPPSHPPSPQRSSPNHRATTYTPYHAADARSHARYTIRVRARSSAILDIRCRSLAVCLSPRALSPSHHALSIAPHHPQPAKRGRASHQRRRS